VRAGWAGFCIFSLPVDFVDWQNYLSKTPIFTKFCGVAA
jgi:hypothetical protein